MALRGNTVRTASAVLAATAFLAACGGGTGPSETIRIGLAGPLSLPNGRSMRLAADMAVDEVNQAGGIDGRLIELVPKDDQASTEQAIRVAAELRDDPTVVAVVGHINSAATLAAAGVYNDSLNGVLEISPASSSPRVTDAGPWTFRVCPSDLMHGPALARWAVERLGRSRAQVIYANDDYGRGLRSAFAAAFDGLGGRLLRPDPYLPLMLGDSAVDPYILRARRSNMDVLVLAGQAEGGLNILERARALGYDGPVMGADGITSLKDTGERAEGVYVSSAWLPDLTTESSLAFVRTYEARYGETPDHRGAMTYDVLHLLVRAIQEVGTDRIALRDYMSRVGSDVPPFTGVSGTIAFDENGDVPEKEVVVGVIRDGRLVTAGG